MKVDEPIDAIEGDIPAGGEPLLNVFAITLHNNDFLLVANVEVNDYEPAPGEVEGGSHLDSEIKVSEPTDAEVTAPAASDEVSDAFLKFLVL